MAFKDDVESITGITISGSGTSPTEGQLTQFIKDGVLDVTNRCIAANPLEKEDFSKVEESDTQGGIGPGIGEIIGVVRESGTDNDWRPCRKISGALQSRVTDKDSIYYASKYNPAYHIDNKGLVLVYPAPESGGSNSYKVYYVNNDPQDGSYGTLEHNDTSIGYFPDSKVHLVIIYASIKSLEAKMGEYTVTEEDVELVQAITQNIATLKQQYESAFAAMYPKQQRNK